MHGTTTTAPSTTTKPILAERFKTKLCRTFTAQGTCPYEHRCMFAHGEQELRTKEMNLQDGLTSEETIKAFQQRYRLAAKQQMGAAVTPVTKSPTAAAVPRKVPAGGAPIIARTAPAVNQKYRYDPYSAPVFVPVSEELSAHHTPRGTTYGDASTAPTSCECADCLAAYYGPYYSTYDSTYDSPSSRVSTPPAESRESYYGASTYDYDASAHYSYGPASEAGSEQGYEQGYEYGYATA